MGRKRQRAALFAFMNGEKVGTLTRAANGRLEFTYDRSWLESRSGRPLSLSMPLVEQAYAGNRVENFFDNLLPDSAPIRDRIQRRFGAASNRGFDLLWHVGRDCVGALQLLPEDGPVDVRKIEAEPLNDADIAATLKNYRTMPLGMREDKDRPVHLKLLASHDYAKRRILTNEFQLGEGLVGQCEIHLALTVPNEE